MYLKTIKLIALIITLSALNASAQKVTNSPYSRYGIGDIASQGDGRSVAMGGASAGESSPYYLNLLNPAANTSLFHQRFIFDVGMDLKYTNVASASASQKNTTSTFRYLAGGFAAKPWWFFTFQLKPYSSVGYKFSETYKSTYEGQDQTFNEKFEGEGGINKLSISTSFKFLKMFSVGAQGSVMFGNLERNNSISSARSLGKLDGYSSSVTNSISYSDKLIMHGMQADLGVRFHKNFRSSKDTLRDALRISLGAFLSCDSKLKCKNEMFVNSYHYTASTYNKISYNSYSDTLVCDTIQYNRMTLPGGFGLGASVEFMERLIVNADYKYYDWSKLKLPGHSETSDMKESKQMSMGMQYVYDRYSSRFFRTINYRVGVYKNETYLKLNGQNISDRGFSVGLGLPISSLILNVGANWGKRGTTEHNLYEEKYFLLNFSVTSHDVWFVKRKFM